MIKERITYTDFMGEERTEEFHFNLTSGELAELELGRVGGFQEYSQRLIDSKDAPETLKAFKNLLKMAYGVKTADGRSFIKREEDWLAFISSEAYSMLLFKLLGDPDWAAKFFEAMVPADLAERAEAAKRGEGIATVPTPRLPQDHRPKQTVRKDDIPTLRETNVIPNVEVLAPETPEQMAARIRAEVLLEMNTNKQVDAPPAGV